MHDRSGRKDEGLNAGIRVCCSENISVFPSLKTRGVSSRKNLTIIGAVRERWPYLRYREAGTVYRGRGGLVR